MKKQFLILILFVAAIVAGTSKSFGQTYLTVPDGDGLGTIDCITPLPMGSCDSVDALHPVQGDVYTYSLDSVPTDATVRWFVVNNTAVTTGGDSLINRQNQILDPESGYVDAWTTGSPGSYNTLGGDFLYSVTNGATTYNQDVANQSSIQMSWKYFDGITNQVILVAYVEDAAGCTDNIAVWRIIPEPAFTIDVAVLNDNGDSIAGPTDPITGECVSPIEFATYSGSGTTPDGTLTVDYGENWVFFVVNGANYFDSWMPQFQLTYTGGTAPVAEVSWAYAADADNTDATVWNTVTGSGALSSTATVWNGSTPVIAGASYATVSGGTPTSAVGNGVVPSAGGECIVVRVRLDWGTLIEHDQQNGVLTFAADGVAYDGVGTAAITDYFDDSSFADLNNGGATGDECEPDGFDNDRVDYNITPRPQAENGTPTQEEKTGQGVN